MNDSPTSLPPPFGDDTDEALSALLDDELGAFAEDHEVTEADARARLEAWPPAEARLAELDRVRAAVHEPLPALDDVTRRRLVRGATVAVSAPSSPRRSARPWAKIAAIAAAGIIVVGGIGVAVSSIGSSDNSSSQSAGGSAAAPLSGDVGNLGDITSAAALRGLLNGHESTTASNDESADSSGDSSKSVAPSAPNAAGDSASTTAPASGAGTVDPTQCAQALAGTGDVIFSGSATYRGTPAVVIGVGQGGRTIVFVVSSTDCTNVLASVSR